MTENEDALWHREIQLIESVNRFRESFGELIDIQENYLVEIADSSRCFLQLDTLHSCLKYQLEAINSEFKD